MSQAKYSRNAPSPRYRRLLEQYQQMHLHGEQDVGIPPEQTFPGRSLPKQAPHIKRLIKASGAKTILDYGCGKGQQYWPLRTTDPEEGIEYPDIKSYWGAEAIQCYDPGYQPFMQLPSGKFDGVICTDVLEHCPEEDVPWILADMFSFARLFVFANIASYPARSVLPTGENAHCTVRPAEWWDERLREAAASSPALQWQAWVHAARPEGGYIDIRLGT